MQWYAETDKSHQAAPKVFGTAGEGSNYGFTLDGSRGARGVRLLVTAFATLALGPCALLIRAIREIRGPSLALCLLALFSLGCRKKPAPPPQPPEVRVVTVQPRDVPIFKEWI